MYPFIYRAFLSRLDAEQVHHTAVRVLQVVGGHQAGRGVLRALFGPRQAHLQGLASHVFGLQFAHPLGLAGGFDKDGRCLGGLAALGFSFIEVGTVTPLLQPGNERPRVFRLAEDKALINRMGFPSGGVEALCNRLGHRARPAVPIGVSLGKNKSTPLENAAADYQLGLSRLRDKADFFVVNVSSPNTPELRRLQSREYLTSLMHSLKVMAGDKPLLVKVSPDLTWSELDAIIDVALMNGAAGLIATNTTTVRPDLAAPAKDQPGGLSGQPLRERATAIIRHIYRHTNGRLPIIGVGGIFTGDDVWEKLRAGAVLAQAYTGFIYEGPGFVRKCVRRLQTLMARDGIKTIGEIIGQDA
jgi:dihydroorotate dehydrogenase